MVPLACFHQTLAAGRRYTDEIPLLPFLEIDLVPIGPVATALRRGKFAADIDPRVVLALLPCPPIQLQHKVAVLEITADKSIPLVEHERPVFDGDLAIRHFPPCQVLAV